MSFTIYRKEIQKNLWLALIPAAMIVFALLMAAVWPEFKESAEEMEELMDAAIYQAMLSEGALAAGIGSFEGFFGMELFTILDFAFMGLTVFLGAGIIAREVDKGTLDISLSYPISRYKLPLSKFAAINTYIFTMPLLVSIPISLTAVLFEENIDHVALVLAFFARCCVFFALSAISLLCAAIFLRPRLAYSTAGAVVVGSYILMGLGGLVESLELLRNLSLFYYLDGTAIWASGSFPLDELVIVVGVGALALVTALFIFQHQELTY
ncbi:MAG: ABC transporter permease subunit [Candidatus Hodarchaeales archaeon]|jgi:ABC-2 type transport system permease protein